MNLPRKAAAIVLFVLCIVAGAHAQSLAGITIRADDAGLWHYRDNPALPGLRLSAIELGLAAATVDAAGAPVSVASGDGTGSFGIITPLVNYVYTASGSTNTNWLGTALPIGRTFSFGYAWSWGSGVPDNGRSTFGLVARPVDFASFAATLDAGGDDYPTIGFGVALRPLVFDRKLASLLTFTADAHVTGGDFVMETAGVRLMIARTASLRGWYDFRTRGVGLEIALSLGPSTLSAATPSVTAYDRITVGQVSGFPAPESPLFAFARTLYLRDIDEVRHGPASGGLADFLQSRRVVAYDELLDSLDRAALDPAVKAVVVSDLPSLGGLASAQEFARALGRVRRAGKKVYLYAVDHYNAAQFMVLAGESDWIGVAPTGSIYLSGLYARGFYFKEFLARIGVRVANIATGKTKSAGNPLSEDKMPEEERKMLARYLGDLQAQGLEALARGRGEKLKTKPEEILAAGPFLIAGQALEAGLVDALVHRDELEALVRQETGNAALVTSYPKPVDEGWGPPLFAKRVAVVHLLGNIVNGRGAVGAAIGTSAADMVRRLREDPSVTAILLRVDSGGGSVATSDEIGRQVRLAVEAGKTVVVSMGDVAASGGYYVSADASRIFAGPGTLTGSIGVLSIYFNLAETFAKLGVKIDQVALSESSGAFDYAAPLRERDLKLAREHITGVYDRFVSVVVRGRKLDEARVRELGNGQVWTGREALAHGLVDELGGLAEAKDWLARKLGGRLDFIDYYPGPVSPFATLFGVDAAAVSAAVAGDRMPDGWKALETLIGPYARELMGIIAIGNGPAYYCFPPAEGE